MVLLMWYPLRTAVRFLPLSVTYSLAVLGGRILCAISGEKRRVMAEEFRLALPEKGKAEIGRLVRDSFINYCVSEVEVLLYPYMDRAFIEKTVHIEGREHLDAALARGRGVLLFQAHFGAFQMTMPAVGYSGYTMNQISASASLWKEEGASEAQKRASDIKARHEYTLPVKHISISSSLRPLFRALKANEIVGITVDGGGGKKYIPVRFLGREANFQTGAADIALSTGAEIVPAFITTEGGIRHRLVMHEPIRVDAGLGKEEAQRAILEAFASLLEGYIRQRPEHYGYTLCLRRTRAGVDPYPFFTDYDGVSGGDKGIIKAEGEGHAEKT
jgi:KDO2-lipid IV(A) lauroyltransferase